MANVYLAEAEGTYYIAMEYLDGRSLKELIVARGPAPIHLAVDYARQILAALRFAHRHGIVHRDIKPHNVLVDGEGRLKVTDFGIARAGASQMTEVGSIIGTAQYLSPEQAKGAPVDQTSDLYSVGVVLYELLTGVVPFTGDTPVEIAMKHLSMVPEAPSAKRAEIPRDLDMVIMRALAKDPSERYHSAEEMDADLRRVARGVAISPATEEAATAIISRPPPTAVTEITPRTREAARGLAVVRRVPLRGCRDRRRLLPLRPDSEPDQRLQDRQRREVHRPAGDHGRQEDPRHRAQGEPGAAAESRRPRDVRVRADAEAGRAHAEGELRDAVRVVGPAAGEGAERGRGAARQGALGSAGGEPEGEDRSRGLRQAGG